MPRSPPERVATWVHTTDKRTCRPTGDWLPFVGMAKRVGGSLFMIVAVGALIGVEALAQGGWLTWFDWGLNGARGLVPVAIALAILGGVLLLAAMMHGLVVDPNRALPGSIVLDGRVVTDESIKSGAKVSIKYRGRTTGTANQEVAGFFPGRVLFSRAFYEQTRMGDLKNAWRSGEWLHVHRYLRATVGLAGFLSLVTGLLVTWALLTDTTAARLLFLGVVMFMLAGTARAFARAR
jgi:hypothetical protein